MAGTLSAVAADMVAVAGVLEPAGEGATGDSVTRKGIGPASSCGLVMA